MKKIKQKNKGFTLIEILVAIGIFTATVTVLTTSYLTFFSAQRHGYNKQQVMNEFRYILDSIGKEVTSGTKFPSGCENGCTELFFTSRARPDMPSRNIEYKLKQGSIIKATQSTYGQCQQMGGVDENNNPINFHLNCYQPISSPDIHVAMLRFFINHREFARPVVSISVEGTMLPGTKYEEIFQISSTYTPRVLQNPSLLPEQDTQPPVISNLALETWSEGSEVSEGTTVNYPRVRITGEFWDNVGVTSYTWTNLNRSQEPRNFQIIEEIFNVNGHTLFWRTWDANAWGVHLKPGAKNTVRFTASDGVGNSAIQDFEINDFFGYAAVKPGKPQKGNNRALLQCDTPGVAFWVLPTRTHLADTSMYHVFRCNRTLNPGCNPDVSSVNDSDDYVRSYPSLPPGPGNTQVNFHAPFQDFGLTEGHTYRYVFVAYNHLSGYNFSPSENPPGNFFHSSRRSVPSDPVDAVAYVNECGNPGTPPGEPEPVYFELQPNSNTIKAYVSGSSGGNVFTTDLRVQVIPSDGFSSAVDFELISSTPDGIMGYFNPNPVSSSQYDPGVLFYAQIPDDTPLPKNAEGEFVCDGTHEIRIQGKSGSIIRELNQQVFLIVCPSGGGEGFE